MINGRALLVGVPEYESNLFSPLKIVAKDLELMEDVLSGNGYNVRLYGLDPVERTKSKIFGAYRRAVREVKGNEILILYFSGHGLHYKGKDYLIPSDADPSDIARFQDYLIPLDFAEVLEDCTAQTIVLFVDACRSGVKLEGKTLGLVGWGTGERHKGLHQHLVTVLACETGQEAQFINTEDGYSLFTKALADAFQPADYPKSLKEVLDLTQLCLDELASTHGKQKQRLRFILEAGVENSPLDRIVVLGKKESTSITSSVRSWVRWAQQSALWSHISEPEQADLKRLLECSASIIDTCEQLYEDAKKALPQNPWFTPDFTKRTLERLEFLVLHSDPPIELTSVEVVLALTAPFVRAAILANGICELAKTDPFSWSEASALSTVPVRNCFDQTCRQLPQLARKAVRLQNQGDASGWAAVITWLMHRCLWRLPELWNQSPDGLVPARLMDVLATCAHDSLLTKDTFNPHTLIELARSVAADPERLEREEPSMALEMWLAAGTASEQKIRLRLIGYLLSLSGWMAIDPTMLSDVIVDHIGLKDPLIPTELHRTLEQCRWVPIGRARVLHVTCPHPAIDLALREHVRQIEETLFEIESAAVHGPIKELHGLPSRVSSEGILPAKDSGLATYSLPHVRFRLAQDEIRELLMGEQLYGDPALAIRELYQNALDACRYREARHCFLQRTGRLPHEDASWVGFVRLSQGTTSDGETFIECEDNGIGMDQRCIAECFARAGRRFITTPEYLDEQAEWMTLAPPVKLFPNSQFGIGVFSYFMLADTITIDTCRLTRKGVSGERLRVHISGSGSLFRIQSLGPGSEAGTRVRLYLNKPHFQDRSLGNTKMRKISVLDVMTKLLYVAEFKTTVTEGETSALWEPGRLEMREGKWLSTGHPDVWWWTEIVGLPLSDGLLIHSDPYDVNALRDRMNVPVIVNFNKQHRPALTIDRKHILGWDRDWLNAVLDSGSGALMQWPETSIRMLWELHKFSPKVAHKIANALWKRNRTIRGPYSGSSRLRFRNVGWVPVDAEILGAVEHLENYTGQRQLEKLEDLGPSWLIKARLSLFAEIWEDQKSNRTSDKFSFGFERAFQLFPRSHHDASSASCLSPPDAFVAGYEEISAFQLVCLATYFEITPPALLKRLTRYSKAGLKLPPAQALRRIVIQRSYLELLSGTGSPPFNESIDLVEILNRSVDLSLSVGTVLRPYLSLAAAGLKLTGLALDRSAELSPELESMTVTLKEVFAVAVYDSTKESPSSWNRYKPGRLVSTAAQLKQSLRETYDILSRFNVLGIGLPRFGAGTIPEICVSLEDAAMLEKNCHTVTKEDAEILVRAAKVLPSYQITPYVHNWINSVSAEHIRKVAKELDMSTKKVSRSLRRFRQIGLSFDGENGATSLAEVTPSRIGISTHAGRTLPKGKS